ncbi:MAG: GNAT family N-acetyltransferase [Betaproteobacteria bacterium]|nr:GNAT family N-acetyltransferase [Betaproteobacteria bacterium]MDH5222371.1 GNAT family N-acetyltransferase [Betaproteobacteria bacterium]MDH5350711.1 GNAT family N-acetyltransferase [Betaproteobacteria bacterium]
MLRIDLCDWHDARDIASRIRTTVFVEEQRVPPEIEMDDRDAASVHALAFVDGAAVGTGRLLPDGHIGRMAVLREARASGVGSAMLERLVEEARRLGFREAVLSAQTHALAFYRKHGFEAVGEVYEEAGIPHQEMRRTLKS